MLRKEMSKSEIERELLGKGDYVLIDNMTRFLKENPAMDIKKFLSLRLVEVYERRKMFLDAADVYVKLVEITATPTERVGYMTKATECYIKSGNFERADIMLKRALAEAKPSERSKINNSIREFYKAQAQIYEKEKRRSLAVKTYEKMITSDISSREKEEINYKLLSLYKELGMIKEYMVMQEKLGKR